MAAPSSSNKADSSSNNGPRSTRDRGADFQCCDKWEKCAAWRRLLSNPVQKRQLLKCMNIQIQLPSRSKRVCLKHLVTYFERDDKLSQDPTLQRLLNRGTDGSSNNKPQNQRTSSEKEISEAEKVSDKTQKTSPAVNPLMERTKTASPHSVADLKREVSFEEKDNSKETNQNIAQPKDSNLEGDKNDAESRSIPKLVEEMLETSNLTQYRTLAERLQQSLIDLSKSCNKEKSGETSFDEVRNQTSNTLLSKNQDLPAAVSGITLASAVQQALQRHQLFLSTVFQKEWHGPFEAGQTAQLRVNVFGRIQSEIEIVQAQLELDEDDDSDDEDESMTDSEREGDSDSHATKQWAHKAQQALIFLLDMNTFFATSRILESPEIEGSGHGSWFDGEIKTLQSQLTESQPFRNLVQSSVELLQSATTEMTDFAQMDQKDTWELPRLKQDLANARELVCALSKPSNSNAIPTDENDAVSPDGVVHEFDQTLSSSFLPMALAFVEQSSTALYESLGGEKDMSDDDLQSASQKQTQLRGMATQIDKACSRFESIDGTILEECAAKISRTQKRLRLISERLKIKQRVVARQGPARIATATERDEIRHDKRGIKWYSMYLELVKYQKEHGHCSVPRSHKVLGRWTDNQRSAYKRGTLEEAREIVLSKLGFGFDAQQECRIKQQRHWKDTFQRLCNHREQHNGSFPGTKTALGKWLDNQRIDLTRWREAKDVQKPSKMMPEEMLQERFDMLKSIGVIQID